MSPTSARIESMAATHSVSPLDALEFFLERAAVREYCGGQSRPDAESSALDDVEQWLQNRAKAQESNP
jgi:hypothetical protein